jgi:YtkA-like
MKRFALPVLAVLVCPVGALALGCASGPDSGGGAVTFPEAALSTLTSDDGAFTVEVRTAPDQPPSRGVDAVEYRIAKGGAPAEGLAIEVVPWMPEMGHGASVAPVVTAEGGGRYLISNLEFFMPGEWELRTTITGPSEDSAAPVFQIP